MIHDNGPGSQAPDDLPARVSYHRRSRRRSFAAPDNSPFRQIALEADRELRKWSERRSRARHERARSTDAEEAT